MVYTLEANSNAPALIIYVLDVSASMNLPFQGRRRIEVVEDALYAAIRRMTYRSTKGQTVQPRYRVAMLAYSDKVFDVFGGGILTIDQVAQKGKPKLPVMETTDTARAFQAVLRILEHELPTMQHCPAPLVCHMTDGEYTNADPEPIARQIMQLAVPDGNVLLENIFISDRLLEEPINQPAEWPGITATTPLKDAYARKLRALSSPLPASYRANMVEAQYRMSPDAVMMLPGSTPELVEMGFVMSTATPVAR